jgi:hypothetical protein
MPGCVLDWIGSQDMIECYQMFISQLLCGLYVIPNGSGISANLSLWKCNANLHTLYPLAVQNSVIINAIILLQKKWHMQKKSLVNLPGSSILST